MKWLPDTYPLDMELQLREELAESINIVDEFTLSPTGAISQHDVVLSSALEGEVMRKRINARQEAVKIRSWKEFYEGDDSTARSVPEF